MKKDEFFKISTINMDFVRENKDSKCPVVQAVIDRVTNMGPEIDILPYGSKQNNPLHDMYLILNYQMQKQGKKIFKDKNGKLLKPVRKIDSFGKTFIVFKYVDSKCFLVIRKDKIKKSLNIVSN